MVITETDKDFEITFQYSEAKIRAVKSIPGAWFKSTTKTWHVAKHRQNELIAMAKRFGLAGTPQYTSVKVVPEQIGEIPAMPDLDISLELKKEPFPYQLQGIAYNRMHERVLICDQQGLGKSIQAIGSVCSYGYNGNHLDLGPGLVICPSTLKYNWQKEWKEVAGVTSMILRDPIKKTWPQFQKMGLCDVFIVNFESLKKYFVQEGWHKPKDGTFRLNTIPFLDTINIFKWIIIDESHKCKDGSTQQAKFVMGITKNKQHVFELTGTPLINKPKDLISQLVIINRLQQIVSHIPQPIDNRTGKPADASGYKRFVERYCEGSNGASNLNELHYRLRTTCFYRREKHEVLKDLPAKTRQVILCDISTRAEYEAEKNRFVQLLKEAKACNDQLMLKKLKSEVLVNIIRLKAISARGKLAAVKEYMDDIVDSGEKFGLFFHLREIVRELKEDYPEALVINGEVSLEQRNIAVERFQNDQSAKLIFLNDQSAGVGLTLTAASRMGFIEFPWTYALCEQCEDRFHRIGQKDNVLCAYFIGQNTIDEYCYEIVQQKKDLAKMVTGSSEEIEEQMIDNLLNLFNQR